MEVERVSSEIKNTLEDESSASRVRSWTGQGGSLCLSSEEEHLELRQAGKEEPVCPAHQCPQTGDPASSAQCFRI